MLTPEQGPFNRPRSNEPEQRRTGAWIDVFPFRGRDLVVHYSGRRMSLNPALQAYADELWAPKAAKNYTDSWVPFAHRVSFTDGQVRVEAGAMRYHEIEGANKAIEEGLPFAPELGFNNSLSVGFVTGTEDSKVVLQRRPDGVHVPNTLIQEPCGYMSSMQFVPRAQCGDPQYANDPRLFDIGLQLDSKRAEIAEALGVGPESITYDPKQDLLGAGWKTIEMYFSTTGRVDARSQDLPVRDKIETIYVPFDELRTLLLNQGRLASVDPVGYRPDDFKEMPIIDETILALLFGYRKLTGDNSFDPLEAIDKLNQSGLNIRVFDTNPGSDYTFPTSF